MTNLSANDTAEREFFPMVRCKRRKGEGPRQDPVLTSIHDPLPADVAYTSPIYLLEEAQRAELTAMADTPYAVSGSSIADNLQNQCQHVGMVLYPIYVECDALVTDGTGTNPETVLEWIQTFIDDELGVPPAECRYYHSGGRSLHAHVPRVGLDLDMRRLRDRAREFNEEHGARLDAGIYSRKRQFRLSETTHEKSGNKKTEIPPDATAADIARCINQASSKPLASYAEELGSDFGWNIPETLTLRPGEKARDAAKKLLGPNALLRLPEADVPLSIPEEPYPPAGQEAQQIWKRYNEKEFSPYANAGGGNSRSVAVVTVRGGPFCRMEEKRILVPCTVHAAVSCDGKFVVKNSERPLQISKEDVRRLDFTRGDRLVVIGGRSRKAKILAVSSEQLVSATLQLRMVQEGERRKVALSYLAEEGFDTGKEGPASGGAAYASNSKPAAGQRTPTEAQRLQTQAERDGISSLTHAERRQVAMSLLVREGWEWTWGWFVDQFGDSHDRTVQYTQLKSAAKTLNSEFDHEVEIPAKHECI